MNRDTAAPARQLGIWMCLALVVGNMIGSGIFLLPANLAPYGVNALIGWGVTIAGALCLATVFAALARALPEAAGPYDYVRTALGEPPAFFVMWSYWISTWVTNAAIAIAAVSYLSTLAPSTFAGPAVPAAAAIGFVILFTIVACSGARVSGGVQIVTSVLKILPLLAAVVIAIMVLGRGDVPAQFNPAPVTPGSVAGAAALTLWAMLGFECATVPASRVRDPKRTIPRATLLGTLIVGLIYVASSSAVFLLLPADVAAKSSAPFADLVGSFWGSGAATLVVVFAAISCLGALNGWVLLQGEVPLALAQRGVFPAWFGAVNRNGMPVRAQVAGTGLSIALIAANYTRGLTELFGFMALLATAATLVLYLVASIAALRLMATGRLQRGLLLAVTLIGAGYALWTFYGAGAEATGWGAVLLATGIPVYLFMRFSSRVTSPVPAPAPAAPRE
ncbi:MAG: amino acid permease [Candidatus Parcubacteria bacterium]|nr:amino acid permease [Burkholderiales bacterium]